jgi:hypothetical protein
MEDKMTLADKTFLKRVFPNSIIVISEAPALNVSDKETATESIGVSPMFDDCARALYNHKVEELNFELKQHKSLRCAKCFKKATFQTNCCEFHVYCDDCSKDPAIIAVTCLPTDILTKREIGTAAHKVACCDLIDVDNFFVHRPGFFSPDSACTFFLKIQIPSFLLLNTKTRLSSPDLGRSECFEKSMGLIFL